jgi:hypothetical protein
MKRVVFVCLVVMAFTSYASATTTYSQWTGSAGDGVWTNAGNWPAAGIPNATDFHGVQGNPNYKAGFKTPGNYPTMTSGTVTTDILVFGGANPSNLDDLVINGTTVNVSEYVTLAAGSTDVGVVTMNSGTFNTGVQWTNARFYVTQLGTGTLNMNGGTINVGNPDPTWPGNPGPISADLWITGTSGAGTGTLHLDGGIINANDLQPGTGTPSLIVTNGLLVLNTDRTGEIAGYITAGWLKGGPGLYVHSFFDGDLGTTTVYADNIPEPATICLLGLGVLGLIRRRK